MLILNLKKITIHLSNVLVYMMQCQFSRFSMQTLEGEQVFANKTLTDDYIIEAVTQQIDNGNVKDPSNEPDIIAEPLSTNLSEQEKIVWL
jgi:hypothetical protein